MTRRSWRYSAALALAVGLLGCLPGPVTPPLAREHHEDSVGPVSLPVPPAHALRPVTNPPHRSYRLADVVSDPTLDMKLLVVSADGQEQDLAAITGALDYLGTPYTLWVATQHAGQLTPAMLADGSHGHYQGVILTTADLGHSEGKGGWVSALSQAEWDALVAYEGSFGVRQVSWYTYPDADHGFQAPDGVLDTTGHPVATHYTAPGATALPYLQTGGTLPLHDTYAFQAKPLDATVTPWLTDAAGHAYAAVKRHPDGQENLAFTFDTNPWSDTSWALAYGAIRWVSGGALLGDRQATFAPQADDLFLPTVTYGTQVPFRIGKADLEALNAWFQRRQANGVTAGIKLAFAFNAGGITNPGADELLTSVLSLKDRFLWISHTWTHPNLDTLDYATCKHEFEANQQWAAAQGLPGYDARNLVTPQISGLGNAACMQAAYDLGTRWVVGDVYKPGLGNPTPNAGLLDPVMPGILVIPRVTSNIYWDTSTPAELVAEYNDRNRTRWGRDLSYTEILDKESMIQLLYLLKGDADPWMFHQADLHAYDGTHSIFTDVMDLTIDRYLAIASAPLLSPPMEQQAARMQARMAYNAAGVTGTYTPGRSITLHATQAATVPVTGMSGPQATPYAGDQVTYVPLGTGQTLTLPLNGAVVAPTAAPTPTLTPTPTVTPTPTPMASPGASTALPVELAKWSSLWNELSLNQRAAIVMYWNALSAADRRRWIDRLNTSSERKASSDLQKLLLTSSGKDN